MNDASAKTKGFLQQIRKASFLKDAAMVTDICARLKKLSLFLQKPGCNIGDCQGVITSTIDGLIKLKEK